METVLNIKGIKIQRNLKLHKQRGVASGLLELYFSNFWCLFFFLSRSAQLSTGTSSQDRHGTESSSCLEDLMQQLLKDLTDTTETSAGV